MSTTLIRNGGTLIPWQKGQSGNPTGYGGRYAEVRRIAAEASPQAMRDLIAIASDPAEDSRVRVVAIQTILDRGLGKPREHDPRDESQPTTRIDVNRLTSKQRQSLIDALRAGVVQVSEPETSEASEP
jgi:hypothetical protein